MNILISKLVIYNKLSKVFFLKKLSFLAKRLKIRYNVSYINYVQSDHKKVAFHKSF